MCNVDDSTILHCALFRVRTRTKGIIKTERERRGNKIWADRDGRKGILTNTYIQHEVEYQNCNRKQTQTEE